MLFVDFPITGPLRTPLLIMEWILIIISLEQSLIFLFRYKKQEKDLRNLQELGYSVIFLGFSLMSFFFILSDYYSSDKLISNFYIWSQGSVRYIFLNCGYFSIMVGAFFFLLCVEKYKVFLFRRFFFTFLFLISIILFLILFFIDIRITQIIQYFFWPVFLFFFLIYIIEFINKVQNKEKLLIGLLKYLSGLIFLLIGFTLTTDALTQIFGLESRLLGVVFQLIGLISLSFFYLTLPPFSEFDWQDKIETLYLINEAGICLYYKYFKEEEEPISKNVISAVISSINVMLRGLTGRKYNEGFSVIKKKGENIIIYHGKFVRGILFTTEELNFVKVVLKDFVKKFEALYNNILKDWDGEMTVFKPIEIMVNNLFYK